MADWRQNYNATSAPLIVGDLVVAGTAGGEQGVRGFLAAYDQATGKEAWRFWTVPKPGEPGSETWMGTGIEQPGGVDVDDRRLRPALSSCTGRPAIQAPTTTATIGSATTCTRAPSSRSTREAGQLKWHFQFTPHNVWDWDAQQPTVLIDTTWEGRPRKLLVQASRNGFFYVLDRTDGKFLLAKPFVKHLTWAREIGADGRPVLVPGQVPTAEGTRICPSAHGAANWYSTSYSPQTGLYYVQTLENCNVFVKSRQRVGRRESRTGAARRGRLPMRRTRRSCAPST